MMKKNQDTLITLKLADSPLDNMIVDNEAMQKHVRKYVADIANDIHNKAYEIATEHTSFNENHDVWYNTDLEEVTELMCKELKHFL